MSRVRVRVLGVTQGVGFRPYVWRLAQRFNLTGWVQNDSAGLRFEVQGQPNSIQAMLEEIRRSPPPLARIDTMQVDALPAELSESDFAIRISHRQPGFSNPVTPDIATCADCLTEMLNGADRRYQYPFINCTNCGPRFTIVEELPYDRRATTMKSFPMCPDCLAEYDDPANRRFHAQPNACSRCGPNIWFDDGSGNSEPKLDGAEGDALQEAGRALRSGKILAVKGIGGFHLLCDARNLPAVARLRERKGRADKPFAIMAIDVQQIRQFARVDLSEQQLLQSKERPIVLLRKTGDSDFAPMLQGVSPSNDFVGTMLPYSPLHYLLIASASPLVVTSGNISDEPIVRTNLEASQRLGQIADCFVFHNRDIHSVCDDSVVRSLDGQVLPIRRSRGYAPLPVRLPQPVDSVLAVGGELKATFCVTKDDYAYMSQHIGDVGSPQTLMAMQRNVEHYLRLFGVQIQAIAGDMHPGYLSAQWARQLANRLQVPFVPVQHHAAHSVALMAEQPSLPALPMIAVCFDGTGYGPDGAIWGGEFLRVDGCEIERIGHVQYFPLPGGDASIKHPYRTALSLLAQQAVPWDQRLPCVAACTAVELRLLGKQIERKLNCVNTSSMGRLFDAIAALIGIRQQVSYEAQAAMELEALAAEAIDSTAPGAYTFHIHQADVFQIDASGVVHSICEDVLRGESRSVIAAKFHHAVARMIRAACELQRSTAAVQTVGLTGGVFQNVLLHQLAKRELIEAGFEVLTHSRVPPNDGGLALGQAVIVATARSQ